MMKTRGMKKGIASLLAAALVGCMGAPVLADSGTMRLTGADQYKAVRLTPPVYYRSNPDLSDLRVLDENGETVPYFIQGYREATVSETAACEFVLVDMAQRNGHTQYDFDSFWPGDTDLLASSIVFDTGDESFAKRVELRGSYDGQAWAELGSDTLYRVDGREKLTLQFGRTERYTHYRLTVRDNAEGIAFGAARTVYDSAAVDKAMFTEVMNPVFYLRDDDATTDIVMYGMKNLKIQSITIVSESRFMREFTYAQEEKAVLYNLQFGDTAYRDTTLSFEGYRNIDEELIITVQNGDDKPIAVSGLVVTYLADEVVFAGAPGQTYTLSFGDPSITTAPVYDVENYKELVLEQGYDIVLLENIVHVHEGDAEAGEAWPVEVALNVVLVLVSVLLGGVILVRLRKTRNE